MPYFTEETARRARNVVEHAIATDTMVAVAESCTGGLVCAALTDVPGASDMLLGGVVSYANEIKELLLDVNAETLAAVGAVSEEVACAMARGVRERLGADIAVSTTGAESRRGASAWSMGSPVSGGGVRLLASEPDLNLG